MASPIWRNWRHCRVDVHDESEDNTMDIDEAQLASLSLTAPVLTLANAFCEWLKAAGDEAEEVRSMLLCAGTDLAQTVGSGRWADLEVGGFLDRFAWDDERRRGAAAIQLMGFYGWLEILGLLEPGAMKRQVQAIAGAAPGDPAIRDYCAHLQKTADEERHRSCWH